MKLNLDRRNINIKGVIHPVRNEHGEVSYVVSPYLDTPEAARYLGISESYLIKLRGDGMGPPYRVIEGERIQYYVPGLDSYFKAQPTKRNAPHAGGRPRKY